MYRPFVHCHRGFLHRLRQRGMGVIGARHIFDAGGHFHCHDAFGDHVRGMGGKDLHAEQAIGFGIADNLDHALGFID